MRVDLSGQKLVFPQQCACCGGTPHTTLSAAATRSTGTRVVHSTTKSWDFPYCGLCVAHVRAADKAATAMWVIAACSLLAAASLYFLTAHSLVGALVGIAGIAGAVYAHAALMAKAEAMRVPGCVTLRPAVGYLGWQGTCHSFEITSQGYALAFIVANVNNLVNASPEMHRWLQANGYAPQPHRPQSPRRHTA